MRISLIGHLYPRELVLKACGRLSDDLICTRYPVLFTTLGYRRNLWNVPHQSFHPSATCLNNRVDFIGQGKSGSCFQLMTHDALCMQDTIWVSSLVTSFSCCPNSTSPPHICDDHSQLYFIAIFFPAWYADPSLLSSAPKPFQPAIIHCSL